ncbi:MAG: DUF6438 domain-containing protein [bacterium]|nr:DUF6438 domain-containing protein [bacterium]
MTKRTMMALGAAIWLVGCVTDRGEVELDKPTAAGDIIRFSASRCFGACPAYSVRVTPDGSGLLEPERFTAVPGPTRFTVTVGQYRRFRAALAPYRPLAGTVKRIGHGENCTRFATDMPGYTIEWTRGNAKPTRLEFQSGCMDAKYARLRTAIAAVPKMLDIEPMLKPKAAS